MATSYRLLLCWIINPSLFLSWDKPNLKMPHNFISIEILFKPEKVAIKIVSYLSLLPGCTSLQEFQYFWNMNFFKIFLVKTSHACWVRHASEGQNALSCLTEKFTWPRLLSMAFCALFVSPNFCIWIVSLGSHLLLQNCSCLSCSSNSWGSSSCDNNLPCAGWESGFCRFELPNFEQ